MVCLTWQLTAQRQFIVALFLGESDGLCFLEDASVSVSVGAGGAKVKKAAAVA